MVQDDFQFEYNDNFGDTLIASLKEGIEILEDKKKPSKIWNHPKVINDDHN